MKIIKYTDRNFDDEMDALANRADLDLESRDDAVRRIVRDVKDHRDRALLEYTNKFDRADYRAEELRVSPEEVRAAYGRLREEEVRALRLAAGNVRDFHQRQVQQSWECDRDGVVLGQRVRPLRVAGIYVPGGKASYPSSVLMNAIPAKVAGVRTVVMCSPTPDREIRPHVLVAADLAGVDMIFKVGGAQAVAAMAYGTPTIPRVDKIVGPGNIYVALAKRLVFGLVDIDMIAGPSEILIVADASARPGFVAADLLSQAEHDELAVPILVTDSETLLTAVQAELETQKKRLDRRDIVEASLASQCRLILVRSLEEAVGIANRIAPEHLELAVEKPRAWADKIENAGAVFLGHFTPEAIGDYLAGPNHVLPTSGTARFSSPLGAYDFVKKTSVISYTQEALKKVAEPCVTLALMENLDAHAGAVKIRVS
ncbi:MAG: histidinol dehydrogenase [Nitrospinae bacterium]|nr:histidinol dehydrogenase [Nitrospinota bacterium]